MYKSRNIYSSPFSHHLICVGILQNEKAKLQNLIVIAKQMERKKHFVLRLHSSADMSSGPSGDCLPGAAQCASCNN